MFMSQTTSLFVMYSHSISMAFRNKTVVNNKTGQSIRFIQTSKDTNGALLEMETKYDARSKMPASHYHPAQQEFFTVLKGELTVKIDNELSILKEGDQLHVPPGTSHAMWNNSDVETIVNWKVMPAKNTEFLLETAMGLSTIGKTGRDGMPGILQGALLAKKYSKEYRLSKPPVIIQNIIFSILQPIAWLTGHRAVYRKLLN